jgi:2-methylcitrate dehydratase PrpD
MTARDRSTTAFQLAEFICGLNSADIPTSAIDMAKRCVLDALGAAIAGFQAPAAESMRRFGSTFFPVGPATIWFTDQHASPAGAAMINSAAACAQDLDDGHRQAGGHPGASIIPASLASAEAVGADGKRFLSAVSIGYEIGVRISAARDMKAIDTYSTGRWCSYGTAAAGGWLRGLSPGHLAQALAISGIFTPLQSASAYSKMEHHTKEGIPWATLTGLAALDMAKSGYSGPLDILDHGDHFDAGRILSKLGDSWAIEQTYFKPHSCCRWLHAPIECLIDLMNGHHLSAAQILSVEVHTFQRALDIKNHIRPNSIEGAQYSIPFCLSVVAHEGADALLPFNACLLNRYDLSNWAERVSLYLDGEAEKLFPALTKARLVLQTAQGRLEQTVYHPFGDPANPMSIDDLEQKFRRLAKLSLSDERVSAMFDGVAGLADAELGPLLNAISGAPKSLMSSDP